MSILKKAKTMFAKYFYDLFHFGIRIAHYNFLGEFVDFKIIKGKRAEKIFAKRKKLIMNFLNKKYSKFIESYKDKNVHGNFNKIIWCCWWQGKETAPTIVQKCIESIKKNIGDYKLIIVDKDNFRKYSDIPDDIVEKLNKKQISFAHFADILRLNLLVKHGGIWVDSTMYFCENVFNKFDNVEFNATKLGPKDNCAIFFMGGRPNKTFDFMYNFLLQYNRDYKKFIYYFLLDYSMEIACRNFEECKLMIDTANLINPNIYDLVRILNKPYNEKEFNNICEKGKFFKLSYKGKLIGKDNENNITNYGYIISK